MSSLSYFRNLETPSPPSSLPHLSRLSLHVYRFRQFFVFLPHILTLTLISLFLAFYFDLLFFSHCFIFINKCYNLCLFLFSFSSCKSRHPAARHVYDLTDQSESVLGQLASTQRCQNEQIFCSEPKTTKSTKAKAFSTAISLAVWKFQYFPVAVDATGVNNWVACSRI